MAIVYRTTGAWGAGLGVNLSAAQVDNNFWEVVVRLVALETSGIQPNNIESITVIGSQMTIFMEDASTFGPFTVPVAMLHWRGEWVTDQDYNELDLVWVEFDGVYMVLRDHTSDPYAFDAGAVDVDSNALYFKLMGLLPFTFDLPVVVLGVPADGALIFKHTFNAAMQLPSFGTGTTSDVRTLPTANADCQMWFWRTSNDLSVTFAEAGANDTITRASGSFITEGYGAGQSLRVRGSASNDGTYVIDSLTATVLTLSAADDLANEGPLSVKLSYGSNIGALEFLTDGSMVVTTGLLTEFNIGDGLEIYAPTPQDVTLADFSATLHFNQLTG